MRCPYQRRRRPWDRTISLVSLLFLLFYLIRQPADAATIADDDDSKGYDDEDQTYEDAAGWSVLSSGSGCYTATKPLQSLSLRMCPLMSAEPLTLEGKPFMWVNGTVTNVGKKRACGFSFTSLDADLLSANKTIPSDLPVSSTTDLRPGEVLAYAFLLPLETSASSPPFVSMSNDVEPCVAPSVPAPSPAPGPLTTPQPSVEPTMSSPAPAPTATATPAPTPAARAEAATGRGGRPPLQDAFTSTPVLTAVTSSAAARVTLSYVAVALAALVAVVLP